MDNTDVGPRARELLRFVHRKGITDLYATARALRLTPAQTEQTVQALHQMNLLFAEYRTNGILLRENPNIPKEILGEDPKPAEPQAEAPAPSEPAPPKETIDARMDRLSAELTRLEAQPKVREAWILPVRVQVDELCRVLELTAPDSDPRLLSHNKRANLLKAREVVLTHRTKEAGLKALIKRAARRVKHILRRPKPVSEAKA